MLLCLYAGSWTIDHLRMYAQSTHEIGKGSDYDYLMFAIWPAQKEEGECEINVVTTLG